jgi:hypothetical protein
MKKQMVVSAMVAALSSAATIGIWTSITPASAGGSTQSVSNIAFIDADSDIVTADPGHFDFALAHCPSGTEVVSGGYSAGGFNGLAVASVVKAYPSKATGVDADSYVVEVVNPEGASAPINFEAKAVCARVTLTVSASLP